MPGKPILLVEDNADHEALTLRILRKSKVTSEVVVARDGLEALEYLARTQDEMLLPSVVLLDLKLPKVDGFEVLRRIRDDARTAAIPVVVLTSSGEEQDIDASFRLGANSYVLKPLDHNRFLALATELGLQSIHVNHQPAEG